MPGTAPMAPVPGNDHRWMSPPSRPPADPVRGQGPTGEQAGPIGAQPNTQQGMPGQSGDAYGNATQENWYSPGQQGPYGGPDQGQPNAFAGGPGATGLYPGGQPNSAGRPDEQGQYPLEGSGQGYGTPWQQDSAAYGQPYGASGQPDSAGHGQSYGGSGQPDSAGYSQPYAGSGEADSAVHGGSGAQWQQASAPWQQGAGPQGPGAGQQGWNTSAPVQYGTGGPGQPGPSLDDVQWRRAKKAPGSGWRKAVHHVSGGAINPGLSAEERRLQELVARIRQPVRGDYRIAVLSLKGGVGKTTTTMGLGSIFASIRGDRVIAVDANPDFGTLSQRVPLQTRSTVRDLLLDPNIQRYSDVRRHTSQGGSRLEVLASERDPAASEAFSEEEYRAVARILQRFYNIILTDCGTGLMHSAMAGVLDLAHSLVLISSSAIDGARSAAATLDWLSLHGHDHLVRNAVVVINLPRPGAANVGINQLRDYFLSRCRAVHIIPYDAHLSEGAEIDLSRLHKQTKRSLVELAATVADDFATDHRRYRG